MKGFDINESKLFENLENDFLTKIETKSEEYASKVKETFPYMDVDVIRTVYKKGAEFALMISSTQNLPIIFLSILQGMKGMSFITMKEILKKYKANFIFFMNDLYWNTSNVLIIKCNR